MTGDQPTYRDLWLRIRDDLPKKGRRPRPSPASPSPRSSCEGALHSLYGNYEKYVPASGRQNDGSARPRA